MTAIPGEALATRIEVGVDKILSKMVDAELNRIGPCSPATVQFVRSRIRERAVFVALCAAIEGLQLRIEHLESVGPGERR